MSERPKLPHYDPNYCRRVARWTASACVGVLVIELLVLLFVDPSNSRCPGWVINPGSGSATLWRFVAVSATMALWSCYIALRWEQKFEQAFYDSIAYKAERGIFGIPWFRTRSKHGPAGPDTRELDFEQIFLLDANHLFLRVSILWCLACALPLFLMLARCTNAPRYLGY